jgi:hypothetical protein
VARHILTRAVGTGDREEVVAGLLVAPASLALDDLGPRQAERAGTALALSRTTRRRAGEGSLNLAANSWVDPSVLMLGDQRSPLARSWESPMIREVDSLQGLAVAGPAFSVASSPAESAESEIKRLTWSVLDGSASATDRRRLAELVRAQHSQRPRGGF